MARLQICLRRIHGTQPRRPGTRPQRKRLQGPQHQGNAEAHQRARHGPWSRPRRLSRRQRRVRSRRRVSSPGRLQRWWSRPRSGLRALLGARRWHARILGRVIREKSVEERCKPRKMGHVRAIPGSCLCKGSMCLSRASRWRPTLIFSAVAFTCLPKDMKSEGTTETK